MMEAFKDMLYRLACQGLLYWREPMSTTKVENTKFFFYPKRDSLLTDRVEKKTFFLGFFVFLVFLVFLVFFHILSQKREFLRFFQFQEYF